MQPDTLASGTLGGFDEKMAKGPVHVMPPWKAGFEECFSTFNVLVTHDPYAKIGKHGIEGLLLAQRA